MINLKNGIFCNCGANLLETGVIDFGKIYLSYSGDNKFNKGEFEFGTFPSTCPECSNDITPEIQNLLSDIYPDLSDLKFENMDSLLGFRGFSYINQHCEHCNSDLKEDGLYFEVSVDLSYNSLKNTLEISRIYKSEDINFECYYCDEDLYIDNKKSNTSAYEIPLF